MISASCPNCGSPVHFAHGAAPATVCEACRSTVVRELDQLVVAGKVSAFSRDLSPVQLGARGSVDGKDFQVVGVLRKAREGVRWNEWFLLFSDGSEGYLGEGNGFYQVFSQPPQTVDVPTRGIRAGSQISLGGEEWDVVEAAEARVVAAEGTLPFAAVQDAPTAYADLRSRDGRRVGTLDAVDQPPTLWVGRIVPLTAMELEGLRPITGWSDPVLTGFHGPEVTQVRSLACPSCGGAITLRAPGATVNMGCEYCGSQLALQELGDETTARVLEARDGLNWKSSLPLGARGEFEGVQWEVIGVMGRHVVFDSIEYHWTEYFLYNPYRGFRFLTEDGRGHWSFVRQLPDPPSGASGRRVTYQSRRFRHYTGGKAHVNRVLGEFSWEVRVGDQAMTDDYVAPPFMLSAERTKHEVVWSLGEYQTPGEIGQAFDVKLGRCVGMAPHVPNPHAASSQNRKAWTFGVLLLAGVVVLFLGQAVTAANKVLMSQTWTTSAEGETVMLTEPFEVPDVTRRNLAVVIDSTLPRSDAQVHASLINTADGTVYHPVDTSRSNSATGRVWRASPGSYVGRLEVARNPSKPPSTVAKNVKIKVVLDKPWRAPLMLLVFYALLAPIALVLAKGAFETRRWSESDHAG